MLQLGRPLVVLGLPLLLLKAARRGGGSFVFRSRHRCFMPPLLLLEGGCSSGRAPAPSLWRPLLEAPEELEATVPRAPAPRAPTAVRTAGDCIGSASLPA